MAHRPLLVFKKGICKFSDSERIRRNSFTNLSNLIKLVCEDWTLPVIHATFVNRPCAGYLGVYIHSPRYQTHNIEINSTAFYRLVDDSRTPFFQRADLIDTILHELSHYIEQMMYGSTGHSSRFYEILETLHTNNYIARLVEVD